MDQTARNKLNQVSIFHLVNLRKAANINQALCVYLLRPCRAGDDI